MSTLFDRAHEAAGAISGTIRGPFPEIAIVLGSGLGGFVESLADAVSVPYGSIPHFPAPTVAGHGGKLVVGRSAGVRVAVLQGRFHYYEGHDLETVTLPVRVLQVLGVKTLILTAATGGIRDTLEPGDIVSLLDHVNLLGCNPLCGPNDERLGTRFPDMTEVYSRRLRRLADEVANGLDLAMHEGTYACVTGPSYETPAEIRMLRALGADVVGMSTAPEAIVARHAGMEVLAFAVVSNWAAGIAGSPITHEEVIEAGRRVGPRLAALLEGVIARIAGTNDTR
jgi:purine-nucleoside phosphorylase